MSLTRPIQNNDILNNWTYVQEERYFTVVWVSILAAFLFIVLVDKGRLRRIILLIFYFSIFIDLPYYFYNKVIDIGKNSSYFLTGEKKIYFAQYPKNSRQRDSIMEGYERLRMIISELKTENGIRPVYISDDRSPRIAVLQGAVFGQMSSPNENLRTSRTQSIIIKVSDHDPYPNETLKEFVENNKKEPTYSGLIGNIYIYTIPSSLTSKGRSPGVSGK
jgi:hypothetical protein